jgi:hypothetical protein
VDAGFLIVAFTDLTTPLFCDANQAEKWRVASNLFQLKG